jgi:putative molybdopterin biosynthesis protein
VVKQEQFLEVLDRDEAERRWRAVIDARPRPPEPTSLADALGRVLAEDVRAEIDVPCFDRSNMDGFAVRAADTYGASEEQPIRLRVNAESIPTGMAPTLEVGSGSATPIATGGMLPRGADAVLPVEFTDLEDGGRFVVVRRERVPGAAVSFAGTDIGSGETVLFAGTRLTSRETGVLAAIGRSEVSVVRRPRVAILSTGDEIVEPGMPCANSGRFRISSESFGTTKTRCATPSGAHWRAPIWCCSRAAPRRAKATSTARWWANSLPV